MIHDSKWMFYYENGDCQELEFHSNSTFTYTNIKSKLGIVGNTYSNGTWKISNNKLLLLTNNGFKIMKGTLLYNDNYFLGQSLSQNMESENELVMGLKTLSK
tara:strand:+ start:387 stop:692 length:306 start_codon:yes stop_codon:yes gene_type:complete